MDRKFKFRNFSPPRSLEAYANSILEQINTPFHEGHFELAFMTKVREAYFCFLCFQIGNCQYLSDSYSLDPILALERLDENMSQQLVGEQSTPFEALVDTWRLAEIGREH